MPSAYRLTLAWLTLVAASMAAPAMEAKATAAQATTQDTIRIMFIYGSRPARKYEQTEPKWFGGIYGGHVAMEIGPDSVFSFRSTEYPCHLFPHRKYSSKFEIKTVYGMWQTFPPHHYVIADLKRVVFAIPVTHDQKHTIDSLARRYLKKTPYDYATMGMRCASATYDVLARAGLYKDYGGATWWKILLPRDLRALLFRTAGKDWRIYRYDGSKRRVWEGDT